MQPPSPDSAENIYAPFATCVPEGKKGKYLESKDERKPITCFKYYI